MSKRPVNLTLNEKVLEFAAQIMELRGQGNMSAFVEELIRDEYERRTGPLVLNDATPPTTKPVAEPKPISSYHGGRVRFRAKPKA